MRPHVNTYIHPSMRPPVHPPTLSTRRRFILDSSSCAAHLAMAAAGLTLISRHAWAASTSGRVVAREPFGRLEQVADGVWALISTPLGGDRTTLSNGGLIAGRTGVLAIEGFMTPDGARWLATKARELTGRWPTHCVVTHFHADHANGVAGYGGEPVPLRMTEATRQLVVERNQPADPSRTAAMAAAIAVPSQGPSTLDLGGRVVTIVPRSGHTVSDLTLEIDDPSVVFCGDLVWNGMFPNYVDATPTALSASVAALRRTRSTAYVPGHGSLAGEADVARYVAVLGEVEEAAREAVRQGLSPEQAGAAFHLPDSLGDWTLFNRVFFVRAFEAWRRELETRGR
jgi:glyoxylase-like metal-dependent hydrolase (beta-lactamase superfamily II)